MSYFKRWCDWWTYNWAENRSLALFRLVLIVFCAVMYFTTRPEDHGWSLAEPTTTWMVVSIGLSILAGQLLKSAADTPVKDNKATTLATRGSYCPWFVGIELVGPVFCWAGDREKRQEEVEGGKGLGGQSQDVFYEAGWHVLGIGPVWSLHEIRQGGKRIMTGPITAESHPSGTTVDLGTEGAFTIYWGESSQPINAFLGNANRVTVSSRWPHICYVVWDKKRLGTSAVWPLLSYVLSRKPSNSVLSSSQSWYDPGITLSGAIRAINGNLASASETVGYLSVSGDRSKQFKPETFVEIVGNTIGNGTYQVLKSEVIVTQTGTTPTGYPLFSTSTRIFLQGGTAGSDGNGTIQSYVPDDTEGANIAHVIAETLFASWPQGLGLDPDHTVEKWDIPSLEDLGVEAETDGWRSGVLAREGQKADALLGAMLQDHGTLLPIDTASGNLKFQRVREPVGTLPLLADDIYANSLPEIETVHGEQPVDRLIFSFSDRSQNYSDATITVDEDGHASYLEHQSPRTVPMISTSHFDTAAKLAELRSQEELAPKAAYTLEAGREARDLIPGDPFLADDFDEVLRAMSVKIDPDSEKVTLKVIPDFYGARKSDFVTTPGVVPSDPLDPEPDLQFAWVEVPEQLLGTFPQIQTITIPRIRAHAEISFASLWLSRDNTTYTLFGHDSFVQTGGTLNVALPDDGPTYVAQGPEYTELGPDNGSLTQDLSADLTNWGLGRQLAVIVSTAGTEICFLQKATITGASTRRLDGLLRARYDTRKLDHPSGAQVYITDIDMLTAVQDILLVPDEDLYVKTQPGTSAGQVNLSAIPPYGELLYGKGQVPIAPDYVSVRAPFRNAPAFQTGDDITLSWALSTGSTGTGAGSQSAGAAISDPDIPGTVNIEILSSPGGVLQSTIGVDADTLEYNLTNAELVSIFGSEPSAFQVRVKHIANGQASPASPVLTITRVA